MNSSHSPLYRHFVMIGCGKMGGAMLARWVSQSVAETFTVIEPGTQRHVEISALGANVTCVTSYDGGALGAQDALLVAIKPQQVDILAQYHEALGEAPLLSIMAGVSCDRLARAVNQPQAKIIRVMPNLPALIGEGASVCCGNATLSEQDKVSALALCEAVGQAHWVEDENEMHAVTALSGSGPAYLFHVIEAMTQAGVKAGLDDTMASALAIQTVKGAALMAAQSDDSPTTLRENVTSKGGTTAAALAVLMNDGAMMSLFETAMNAAAQQSKTLSEM